MTTITNFTNFCENLLNRTKEDISSLELFRGYVSQACELAKTCKSNLFAVYSYAFLSTTSAEEMKKIDDIWHIYNDEIKEIYDKLFDLYLITLEEA